MKQSKYALLSILEISTVALFMFSAPAFAFILPVSAHVSQEQAAEDNAVMEKIQEDDPVLQKQENETEPEMDPLTPDGNLTLVDDEGPHDENGKQFITVTSKSGNYFYIIIDRDDEGENTVHFLNLVDEADLMALLDEETKDQINADDAVRAAEEARLKAEKEAAEAKETARVAEEASQAGTQQKTSPPPAILTIAALTAGGAGYFYYNWKKKEEEKSSRPDPDDDEYWLDEDDSDQKEEDSEDNETESPADQPSEEDEKPDVEYDETADEAEEESYEDDAYSDEEPEDIRIEDWT